MHGIGEPQVLPGKHKLAFSHNDEKIPNTIINMEVPPFLKSIISE